MSLQQALRDSIHRSMEAGQTPGAVVLVGRGADILHEDAVGDRMLAPERRPMRLDTVFDLASVTKPVATATAVMQLVEQGRLTLDAPARTWLPLMPPQITLRHLLSHSSGLPAYKHYPSQWGETVPPGQRRARVVEDICQLPQVYRTGEGFTYSCLNFICLASIIEIVSGLPLDRWTRQHLTGPLALCDTTFNPADRDRCAATEQCPEGVLRGVVHDENARYLGGVGGNAGLFGTARDLARFMAMVLGGGEMADTRVLRPETVAAMTTPQLSLPGCQRGLGWDIASTYTPAVRGSFPDGSFGHTGYTGTSVWADPASRVFVILLTNRVHLGRDREVADLRREVATAVADGLIGA